MIPTPKNDNSSYIIFCPHCEHRLAAEAEMDGDEAECSNCNQPFIISLRKQTKEVKPVKPDQVGLKACPFCGEQVREIAKKCRYCFETIDVTHRAVEEARREVERGRYRRQFPHLMHLVISLFTCGAWLPVWLIHYVLWSSG